MILSRNNLLILKIYSINLKLIKACSAGEEMRLIEEKYQRITDGSRSFDIRFWQSQGDRAIFEAVTEMLHDYFLIRGKNADESRLQRMIESFRKA